MWIGTHALNFVSRRVRRAAQWVNYKKYVSALMMCLALALATSASAEVDINSPSNGTTVSGTVTIKAYVNNAYWSKLWIDGNGGPTAAIGNVTFQWNSGSVSNGSHVLKVDAYPSGGPPNAADTITVVVNNGSSGGGGGSATHFGTLPSSASLPSDATCAAEIPWESEMVPANSGTNSTMPSQGQLDAYRADGYAADVYGGSWAYARVDGQYTGNTDMIFRWAACKWGIDEDVVRAQATIEQWSWNQPQSGGDERTSYSAVRKRWIYRTVELSMPELLLSVVEHLSNQSAVQLADLADAGQFHRVWRGLPLRLDARLHGWRSRRIFRWKVRKQWPYLFGRYSKWQPQHDHVGLPRISLFRRLV